MDPGAHVAQVSLLLLVQVRPVWQLAIGVHGLHVVVPVP
jgi:hypothetical protein